MRFVEQYGARGGGCQDPARLPSHAKTGSYRTVAEFSIGVSDRWFRLGLMLPSRKET
jgi:hypothetical protein